MDAKQQPSVSETTHESGLDPRIARSRAAIVEAATAHFLERGYHVANVDEIAARAGVSKRTVYNVFDGKEQLFREILGEALDTAERFSENVIGALAESDNVAADLRAMGQRLAAAVLGGRIVPLRRLLIGEAARFPDLARDYYARAPGRVMSAIAEALGHFDERGLLRVDDPTMAAEQLAFLVLGASLDRALFEAVDEPLPADQVESRAAAGVEVFLRAYAPAG
jgi:TetR/AcrR family transcriptional regulator, mexJK operon transcriptional repressor